AHHKPNFVVAHTVCPKCIDKPLTPQATCKSCGTRCEKCENADGPLCPTNCGYRENIFEGSNTCEYSGRWLFKDTHRYFKVIAHNARSYDNYFILQCLVDQSVRPNKLFYSGSKIMYMQVEKDLHIKFLDSLCFLPMRLSELPKTFDLREMKKGWFPHYLNTRENQGYVGDYPDPKYYGIDYMGVKERGSFLEWYGGLRGQIFDFRQEILEYCRSDVEILRKACLEFRKVMRMATVRYEEDGSWVKTKNVTVKQFVSTPIAQIAPPQKDEFSRSSIQWLSWRAKKDNIHIQHALNGGEKRLLGTRYKLDGYCEQTNTCYEYNGDVYLGCPVCFKDEDTRHPLTGQSMKELYTLTLKKKA
ncbi:hypothetical protein ScPMuIL_004066, partial [Solemya velum]